MLQEGHRDSIPKACVEGKQKENLSMRDFIPEHSGLIVRILVRNLIEWLSSRT